VKFERYTCIGIAALAYAIVGGLVLFFFGHPEHEVCDGRILHGECYDVPEVIILGPEEGNTLQLYLGPPVEVQEPIPHKPVREYEVE